MLEYFHSDSPSRCLGNAFPPPTQDNSDDSLLKADICIYYMVKIYYVKQKTCTECVPGNEKKFMAKNGRWMMKCQCAECGITKTRLIKKSEGQGIGDIFKAINIGKKISTTIFPQTEKIFKDFESGKIAREVVNKRDGIQTKRFWKPSKKILQIVF